MPLMSSSTILLKNLATPLVIALTAASSLACASAPPAMLMHAPNPNGCYLMLFERPGFEGANDVLNGPGKWASLEQLRETNNGRWVNRVRSLRVGATATVTVFTQPAFGGPSQRYEPGTDAVGLTPNLAARIQSIDIACLAAGSPIPF